MRNRRVLIIDDEHTVRCSLRDAFLAEGYHVEEAENGEEAVLAVRRGGAFDAIVLDSRLPDTHAVDLLDEIRHISPATPVIVMTPVAVEGGSVSGVLAGPERGNARRYQRRSPRPTPWRWRSHRERRP